MIPRRLAALAPVLLLFACATGRGARQFAPPAENDTRETLAALAAAERRAAELPASRLLYDARMSGGGAPAVPGTLAVTYDGTGVRRASLTGPFGSRVAEYDAGTVTGEDRRALVVDPAALRRCSRGPGRASRPGSRDATAEDCLAVWDAPVRVSATVDRKEQRVDSLVISGETGTLTVTYGGEASPWPQRIAARDEPSGRSLKLSLVAVEADRPAAASPGP